jgi:hypothetical protein
MILNNFEVQITSPSGQPFHEVVDTQTNDVYIVADPGKIFEIRCSILPPRNHRGKIYRFSPEVDGQWPQVTKTLKDHLTRHTSIVGFVRQGSHKSITYDLFKFAAAVPAEDQGVLDQGVSAQFLKFNEGRIEVKVDEVVVAYRKPESKSRNQTGAPTNVTVPSLPEGKKFFLAPSLVTTTGGTSTGKGFTKNKHKSVS